MKCIAQNTRKVYRETPENAQASKRPKGETGRKVRHVSNRGTEKGKREVSREKTKQVNLKFSPNEMDLFDWLKAQDAPVSTTVKRLIREEIDRNA